MAGINAIEAHKLCMDTHQKVKRGGTLYITIKFVMLRDQPTGGGNALGAAVLGEEVVWLGASPFNSEFHKVRFTVKRHTLIGNPPIGTVIEGYIYGLNLSVCKPVMEVYSKNPLEKISSEAFYSSGLAIKG